MAPSSPLSLFSSLDRNALLIGGACGVAAGVSAVALALRSRKGTPSRSTCPPKLQAGLVDDFVLAYETWRDVRPYHSESDADATSSPNVPAPMAPFGPFLMPLAEALKTKIKTGMGLQQDLETLPPHGTSGDYLDAKIPRSKFGYRPYHEQHTKGRPYKVYAGFHMSRQARLWRSATIDRVVAAAGRRPVIIPNEKGVTMDTITGMIMEAGATVYAYGGVLRDIIMKGEHVADDIDILFSCTVQHFSEMCKERGWKEGEDFHLKKDEKTGAVRYDFIAIGEGKEKFSGHTIDSNCAGEFAFNCLLYDLKRKILIDSSGWGVQDAAFNFLRIPYDGGSISPDGKSQWELWSENCDRLPGMSSLRFFNFRSRGFNASPQTVEHCVRWIHHHGKHATADAITTFLERKVIKKNSQEAQKKLSHYKSSVFKDFDSVLGAGAGTNWWAECAEHIAQKLMAELIEKERKAKT